MKLPNAKTDLTQNLQEFDIWVTPSLGEIRDTEKYEQELSRLVNGFELLRQATGEFVDEQSCSPVRIVPALQRIINGLALEAANETLLTIASVLYVVTGKTDNNLKCQFPLFLRDKAHLRSLPSVKGGELSFVTIPRVLKSERVLKIVTTLTKYPDQQTLLFQTLVEFLLSDQSYVSQLWSIGNSYVALSRISKGRDLLAPLAIFQVRGSVSAVGGHDPEEVLRERLSEWGLEAGYDYNESDVTLAQLLGNRPKKTIAEKTRAYDFVIPFRSRSGGPRVFVQSQYYAGDSGSVSHKNVDQTRSTRDATKAGLQDSLFMEYVDGAGYFSSLNGDLRSLLGMPDTASFFQIRSAPIRLRRELQSIGFLTPLEIEHAMVRVGTNQGEVIKSLVNDGYAEAEISRCLDRALAHGVLLRSSAENLELNSTRKAVCRRYLLLDAAALYGGVLEASEIAGKILIPGYGPFYGLRQNDLVRLARQSTPELGADWGSVETTLDDLQWLIDKGFITSSM